MPRFGPKDKTQKNCPNCLCERPSDVSGCQKSGSGFEFFFGFGSGRVLDFFFGFGSGSGYTTRVRVGFRVLFWHIKMPFLG